MEQVKQNYTNLKTYSEKMEPLLDEYKKGYIYYNTSPDNEEYSRIFSIASGNITASNKDLFVTTNNIQQGIDELNVKLNDLNNKIQLEKPTNVNLAKNLMHHEGKGNGSEVLISNSKELYKQQYISNWDMVIGIFIISATIITIFRKPKIVASLSAPLK